MKFAFTKRGLRDYDRLLPQLQAVVDKQLNFLLQDIHYPSLRAKKYDEKQDIWQIRINRDYRLYFQIKSDIYVILTIIKHPK